MTRMKKTRILTAVMLTAALGLTACSGNGGTEETSGGKKSESGEKVLKTYFQTPLKP